MAVWELISFCDAFIEKERPWEKKEGYDKALGCMLYALENITELVKPFLPETSEKILEQISGEITKTEPLFPRL